MKIRFLGTGAADWDWKHFTGETRGSTSTLLNGHILLDAGASGWENLIRNRIDPGSITDLLITHSHPDHFDPEVIGKIAAASGKLRVRASAQASEKLRKRQDPRLEITELHRGDRSRLDEAEITVLPANHALEDWTEEAFHFLFDAPAGRWLYALDGGWMLSVTRRMLAGKPLDLIVWDATSGNHYNDWRFADHNDLQMIDSMRQALTGLGLIREDTCHVFDHIARTLWPESAEEQLRLAEKHRGILAQDGMNLSFPR